MSAVESTITLTAGEDSEVMPLETAGRSPFSFCPRCDGPKFPSHANSLCRKCYRAECAERRGNKPVKPPYVPIIPDYMKPADMERLKELIVRPDFKDSKLFPLLRYKGNLGIGRARRLWNFAITMMETDARSASDGGKMSANAAFTHLCGAEGKVTTRSVKQFFSRLYWHKSVCDNIPGLHEYVRFTFDNAPSPTYSWPDELEPVSIFTTEARCHVPWRTYRTKRRLREARGPKPYDLVYPFVIHKPVNGGAEYEMMMAVNKAVSSRFPADLRADICQDLIVELLMGTITLGDVQSSEIGVLKEITKKNRGRYGDISLDDFVGSDDGRNWHEKISPQPDGIEW